MTTRAAAHRRNRRAAPPVRRPAARRGTTAARRARAGKSSAPGAQNIRHSAGHAHRRADADAAWAAGNSPGRTDAAWAAGNGFGRADAAWAAAGREAGGGVCRARRARRTRARRESVSRRRTCWWGAIPFARRLKAACRWRSCWWPAATCRARRRRLCAWRARRAWWCRRWSAAAWIRSIPRTRECSPSARRANTPA